MLLNLDTAILPHSMNGKIGVKTAHLRSAAGRAAQNKRARERLKRIKKEKMAEIEKEVVLPPILPVPEPRHRPRGRRSKEATERRYSRRAAMRVMARIKAENRIVSHSCPYLPTEFLKKRSQQYVQDTIRSRYTGVKMLYIAGNVEVQCPSYAYFVKQKKGLKISIKRIMTLSLRTIYPSFLVKKFGPVISERQRIEIAEKWELFKKTGAKPSQKKHLGRGTKPAFHFGVWRRYQNIPFITKDSKKQKKASDEFLTVLRNFVARKIATFTENYASNLWSKQKGISNYLSQFENISSRTALDFESAFTTVAVKEGSSDHIHIDKNDQGITWVLPIGEWEGGNMVIPQLGLEIPNNNNEILCAAASIEVHLEADITLTNAMSQLDNQEPALLAMGKCRSGIREGQIGTQKCTERSISEDLRGRKGCLTVGRMVQKGSRRVAVRRRGICLIVGGV
ncbi:hypothetical protein F5887DRAFT_922898 [Amanita rubescens]|nr:hypothetical protein F5887DRAFT_922898 [Amanita rubescens]